MRSSCSCAMIYLARRVQLAQLARRQGSSRNISTTAPAVQPWSYPPSRVIVPDEEINRLAASPRRPLTLADLVKLVYQKPSPARDLSLTSQTWTSTSL